MESTYTFSFLKEHDIPDLYDAFMGAFADYVVPIKLSRKEFDVKIKREGVQLSFCVGAYQGNRLVGFIMTGLGEWLGKPTAYNAGTGVLPEHRGQRLTERMYEALLPKLRESGIEQCLLEVIRQNEAALKVYQRIGFRTTRSLECFRAPKQDLTCPDGEVDAVTVAGAPKPQWQTYAQFFDVQPSWQNTSQAFRLNPNEKLVLEACDADKQLIGYVAFFPKTGSVAQLAVQAGYRSQGIATALLREVVKRTEAPALLVVNVDATCTRLLEFLRRRNFSYLLGQYEMLLPLV